MAYSCMRQLNAYYCDQDKCCLKRSLKDLSIGFDVRFCTVFAPQESLVYAAHFLESSMKFVEPNRFNDPDAAARKLVEIANAAEPVQDGRIHIEKVNGPFLYTSTAARRPNTAPA